MMVVVELVMMMVFDDDPGWAYECMWLPIMLQILICNHCMQLASNDDDDEDNENDEEDCDIIIDDKKED